MFSNIEDILCVYWTDESDSFSLYLGCWQSMTSVETQPIQSDVFSSKTQSIHIFVSNSTVDHIDIRNHIDKMSMNGS